MTDVVLARELDRSISRRVAVTPRPPRATGALAAAAAIAVTAMASVVLPPSVVILPMVALMTMGLVALDRGTAPTYSSP